MGKSILETAKELNKKYENDKLAIVASVIPQYQRMPTGAFGLDYPLYGGLVYGRIHTFAGLYHSGKTTAACLAMAAYQRQNPNKMCVYVDVEHSLDLQFQCRMTGLQADKMLYFAPTILTGEQILDAIVDFQKDDDVGMIILDSIPKLLPAQVLENNIEKDSGMRGTIAKPLHTFLKVMTDLVYEKNNILILINQVRRSGTTFTGTPIYTEPGGDAPHYYSSIKIRFGTRTFIKGDKTDCSDGEGAEGFRLKFAITKSKVSNVTRGGGFLTFDYNTGFRWLEDLIEIADKFGFIKSLSTQTYQLINLETGEVYLDKNGKPLQGRKKILKEYILNNIDFQNEYVSMLQRYITQSDKTYGNILDEREQAEIDAEEKAVNESLNKTKLEKENKVIEEIKDDTEEENKVIED